MHLAQRTHNIVRGLLQRYGTSAVKRRMWNSEFSGGRWDQFDSTPNDCVYPYVERHAENGSVLDLGCGAGNTGHELLASSYQFYTGVDISDAAVEKARRR